MGDGKRRKAKTAALLLAAVVLLALASVAAAATPTQHEVGALGGAALGKKAAGTIIFSPASVVAGSGAFHLTMTLSSAHAAVPAWAVNWIGPTGSAGLSVVSSTTASVVANVPASLVGTPGTASVAVSDGTSSWVGSGFTITPPGPVLSGIVPATGSNGSSSVPFRLSGTNLLAAGTRSTVTLQTAGGVVVETASLYARTATTIDGTFDLASPTVSPGTYNVVLSGGGLTATLPAGFTVTGPKLTSITPSSGVNSNGSLAFTIVGTGLSGLTRPVVTLRSGSAYVTAVGLAAAPSGLSMTGSFNLASPVAPAGLYDVVLSYGSDASVRLVNAFAVNNPIPTMSSISPATVYAGSLQPGLQIVVTGTGFVPAPALVGAAGSRIQIGARQVTDTVFVSGTELRAALVASDIATPSSVAVRVINPTPTGTTGGGTSSPLNLTVAADTTAPVTTISGADDLWHSTEVTLTVSATDAQSGVQKTGYTVDASAPVWLTGSTIVVPADGSSEGANVVTAWSVDWCSNVESPGAAVTVNIDTTGPRTTATVPSSIKKGDKVKFGYRAGDLTPKCDFTLKIRYKATNKSARTYKMGFKSSNSDHSYKIDPNLAKGKYIYLVYADDQAGNPQSKLGQKTFTVK